MSSPLGTASFLRRARSPLAWIRLLAGLWLFAAGVVLGLRARLGVGPWDVLHDGIRQVTPLSFGVATIVVGLVLLAGGWFAGVRPGPGTLVNMVLVGVFADLMLSSGIGADLGGRGLPLRLAAVVAGVALVAIGSALYIGAGLGSGPRDSVMLALAARTRLRVGAVRALIETAALLGGILLGGAWGVGTVLYAFGIGPAIEVAFRLLRVEVPSRRAAKADVEACETC
ncbi:MAG TPA: membrane protein [Actinomycetes bacterium]